MRPLLILPLLLSALVAGEATAPQALILSGFRPGAACGQLNQLWPLVGTPAYRTGISWHDVHADLPFLWDGLKDGRQAYPAPHCRAQITGDGAKKVDLVMLVVSDGGLFGGHKDRWKAAVNGYVNLCRESKVPVLLIADPDKEITNPKAAVIDAKSRYQTVDEFIAERRKQHEARLRNWKILAKQYPEPIAPVFLAFWNLYETHPEIDLHPPIHWNDGHLTHRDAYLFACTIAATLATKKPEAWPTAEQLFAVENAKIAKDNANRRAKQQEERPLLTFTAEEQQAVQDTAWATVAEWKAMTAAPLPGRP